MSFRQKMSEVVKKGLSEGKYPQNRENKGGRRFNSKGELRLKAFIKASLPNDGFTSGMIDKKTRLNPDIWSRTRKVVVEYDGIWHFKDIHGQLADKQRRDRELEEWCVSNGWRIIRISENAYLSDVDGKSEQVVKEIITGSSSVVKIYNGDEY